MSIQTDFYQFHKDNPDVYRRLVALARKARSHGYSHIGIKHIWEVMRWEVMIETKGATDYKLNNNFTSRYARLIMGQEPDLAGVFEVRALRS
jgi:hypothetical protein